MGTVVTSDYETPLTQEAQNFDRQVLTFWSRLMHRDITSQLFFLHLKRGGFGVGSAVQRHAAAPLACVAVSHPFIDDYHPYGADRQFNASSVGRDRTQKRGEDKFANVLGKLGRLLSHGPPEAS